MNSYKKKITKIVLSVLVERNFSFISFIVVERGCKIAEECLMKRKKVNCYVNPLELDVKLNIFMRRLR